MKLKQITITTLMALGAFQSPLSQAASNIFPVGSNLGYGDASNKNSAFLVSANPAWISNNLQSENNYALGVSGGMVVTQKGADQVINQYKNEVQPVLDEMDRRRNGAITLANQLKQAVNNLVLETRDKFHTQIDTHGAIPLQISHNRIGGIGLELSAITQGKERLLSSNHPIELDANYLLTHPTASRQQIIENGLIIQSALYTKTAQYAEGALTYGNQFFENKHGVLSFGIRAKMMQAKLRKTVNDLGTLLKSNNGAGEQVFNDINDALTEGEFESAIGVDIGLMWNNPNWQVGINIQNINNPSFHYNALGDGNTEQDNIERFYGTQITLKETVELSAQTRIEGAVYTKNKHWVLAGSMDLNDTNDLLNNPYQWATVSASYSSSATSDSWWYALVPDVRIGYRSNLTGNQESYITPGLSWGPLDLDVAFHSFDDLSKTSEDNIPEGLAANLSLELQF